MKYILDDNGEPQPCDDIVAWGNWFETASRRVALTNINETYLVSTVFLGVDYRHFKGPAILWETMVFKGNEGLWFDRCGGSREQAEAMHDSVCKKIADRARNACSRVVHEMT